MKLSRAPANLDVETIDGVPHGETGASSAGTLLSGIAPARPLFSIIVPTFNEERFLPGLLESIRQQTFRDYEVIIADDSSTDHTQDIARSYGARIVNNNRIGEFPSRNAAAAAARGSILVFTGADTLMPRTLLALASAKFARDTRLAGIYCPTYPYDAPIWAKLEYAMFHVVNSLINWLTKEANASTAFFAMRTELFRKTRGFQDTCFGDSTFTRNHSKILKIRPCLNMVIFVSGRRTRIGTRRFNRHYIGLIMNVMFRPFRQSHWLQTENKYRNRLQSRSSDSPHNLPESTIPNKDNA